jgi:hypothetical protein
MISREEWGAEPARLSTPHIDDYSDGVFWHWLGDAYPEQMIDRQILQSVQRYHMNTKGWYDIAYNYAIGRTAVTYELRGENQGGATKGYNRKSIAIVFLIGVGELPTPAMLQAAWQLTATLPNPSVRPHRDVVNTTCPGHAITSEIRSPQHKETPPMIGTTVYTLTEAQAVIRQVYVQLLGRSADAAGLDYWADQLVAGARSLEDVRWEFLAVRLAAEKASLQVIATAASTPASFAINELEDLGDRVYAHFLEDLVTLQQGS